MSGTWPAVPIGTIAQPVNRFEVVEPDESYRLLGMRSNIGGPFLREEKRGAEVSATKFNRVKTGDFIYSRLFAWQGSFGLIPPELDDCCVSNEFPVFSLNSSRVLPKYLVYWFGLPTTQRLVEKECSGSTPGTRNRYKEEFFYSLQVPLPPLGEQRRIVAKIEALASRIEEVKQLRQSVLDDAQDMLHSAFSQVIKGAVYRPLEKVAPIVRRPVEVRPDGEYPELGVRSFGNGTFHKPALSGHDVGSKKLFHMESGDIVFSNVFAWEGAIAVVQQEDEGRVASHRFITCVPNEGDATANFLRFFFLTREGLEKIGEASPGGAGRNRTLGLKKLEKIKVPIPDIEKQLRFDKLQAMVTEIKNAQTSHQVELEALLPAILDKAFKGDL